MADRREIDCRFGRLRGLTIQRWDKKTRSDAAGFGGSCCLSLDALFPGHRSRIGRKAKAASKKDARMSQ